MTKTAFLLNCQTITYNGSILSAGKVKTFDSGTSTPRNHYTDKAGSGATNTTTLSSAGRGSIWLDENTAYRVQLLDSSDNVLKTWDGVYGRMNVSGSTPGDGTVELSAFSSQPAGNLLGTDGSGNVGLCTQSSPIDMSGSFLIATGQEYRYLGSENGSSAIKKEYLNSSHTALRLYINASVQGHSNGNEESYIQLSSDNGATPYTTYTGLQSNPGHPTTETNAMALKESNIDKIYLHYNTEQTTGGQTFDVSPHGVGAYISIVDIYNFSSTTEKTIVIVRCGQTGSINEASMAGMNYSHATFVADTAAAHNSIIITKEGTTDIDIVGIG